MLNQTFGYIVGYIYSLVSFSAQNDKRNNFIFSQILDQIQQDNADARDSINKSVVTIYNKEGIPFEQVFYILFSDVIFIILHFDQLLEYRIRSK